MDGYDKAYDELCYHSRSLAQVRMWKREIFTDEEYEERIDNMIAYHKEMYDHFLLTVKIMERH